MSSEHDAFISYNHKDRFIVDQIANELAKRGVAVWIDQRDLPLGIEWQKQAETALLACPVTIVCIGRHGIGKWQEDEIRAALELQKKDSQRRVIPVLLEGASEESVSPFLGGRTRTDLRRGLDHAKLTELSDQIPRKNPGQPAPAPNKPAESNEQRQVNRALRNLTDYLAKGGHVTFFVGPDTDDVANRVGSAPSNFARELLLEAQIINPDYDQLLPPIDVAGLYFAVNAAQNWDGGWRLEDHVRNLISQHTISQSVIYEALAKLIGLSETNPRRRRGVSQDPQLIVTTNLDTALERALLVAGVSFTRVIQHRSASQLTINEYEQVSLINGGKQMRVFSKNETIEAQCDQPDEIDFLIQSVGQTTIDQKSSDRNNLALPAVLGGDNRKVQKPILYKLLGSHDVENSCVISAGQYYEFSQNAVKGDCIPKQISQIIGNSPALFMGYGFLDPGLRLMYYLLIKEQFKLGHYSDMRYALRFPPAPDTKDDYRRIEARIWEGVKGVVNSLDIVMLEERAEVFLNNLLDGLQGGLGP